ncbi:MAG: Lrp/AsnC family transcriptional regulator [Gammaproteobacteria bacterium]|nr:Lrp/AsnC family transcriptional regulator [Gammaproteobacteria bacterium]
MDATDRNIINKLQGGFPIAARPYAEAAARLELSEKELIQRLDRLLAEKVLTRFGPLYNAERLGGGLTLAAMRVPEADFEQTAQQVNAFAEVAHNYARNHAFNMWFVVATERPERVAEVLAEIETQTGLRVYNMPKKAEYYIGLKLDAEGRGQRSEPPPLNSERTTANCEHPVIRATQAGLPLLPRPYHKTAEQIGLEAEEVMACMQRMQANGVIRRIGATPNHYALGYRANGMTVWDVPDERIDELGLRVGALDFVSHCYRRPRHLPDWSYNLFAMVHARDRSEAAGQIRQIAEVLGRDNRGHEVLYSTRILKKTGLRIG